MSEPIGIIGCGGRTPVGANLLASAAAVRSGLSAVRVHSAPIDKGGEPMCYAADSFLDPHMAISERFGRLCDSGIGEALTPLAGHRSRVTTVPLFLGLPEPKPGLSPSLGKEIVSRLQRSVTHGMGLTSMSALPHGHAAGLMALEEAWKYLLAGQAEFCLAGGVDSYLAPETLEWLDEEGQLMSSQNRSGFPPGEAAGFCLLARVTTALRYNLRILARIVNVATAREPCRIKTETICIGAGLTEAIAKATGVLLPGERIDLTYCDMNGERYRNEEFTFGVLRTQKVFVDANDHLHPADCWGDVGAASGPLFAGLAVASALRRYANGPRVLLWASSEGGQRSAAVLYLELAGR